MKTDDEKKGIIAKGKAEIKSDMPMSEKDEVKKAENKMREAQKKASGK